MRETFLAVAVGAAIGTTLGVISVLIVTAMMRSL